VAKQAFGTILAQTENASNINTPNKATPQITSIQPFYVKWVAITIVLTPKVAIIASWNLHLVVRFLHLNDSLSARITIQHQCFNTLFTSSKKSATIIQ
jgi:hypothetical protein